jgi:AcrR family transcriptional regulator
VNRRRSAASIETDERLLEAALDELAAVGIDRLGMIGVARRAQLTTGALYGRYESAHELAADLWQSRVRVPMFTFLDDAVAALVDGGDPKSLAKVLEVLREPPREITAGLELMVCARRIDELEELIAPQTEAWLRRRRATLRARDQRRRAQVLFGMGSVIGMLLQTIPGSPATDWELVLTMVALSFADSADPPGGRFVPTRSGPVRSALGDPHQDALIDAVAAITARVGFERTTASRIARRANLTSGAIYARYHTKDELLTEAVEVLLTRRFADDLAENDDFLSSPDPGTESANVLGGYLSAARRDWRIFRIEAQLASRYRPDLAATIDRVQEIGIRANFESLRAGRGAPDEVLDIMARFRHLIPLGVAFTDLVLPGGAAVDWRLVFVPLVAVIARTSR